MSEQIPEDKLYEEARKRVEAKKGFYIHLSVYVIVNAFLVFIWAVPAGGGFPWFVFPLGGWGIGVFFHFMSVFVFSGHSHWEEDQIKKEMERMRKR